MEKRITAREIRSRKGNPEASKIVAITAYDYTFTKLIQDLVDIVLVGDSLGMVIQGEENTLSVRVEDMIYHTRAVARAVRHSHLVADMPFMSFQTEPSEAIRNAGRLLSEGHAQAVKLEGGTAISSIVSRMVDVGIPVMGHVGLQPQSVNAYGGYRIQGRTKSHQQSILQDALALEDAGVYCMVLEGIPAKLAAEITERVQVPTIGIGAGNACDGQILVSQDLLGMDPDFNPKFVKRYADMGKLIKDAVSSYAREVQGGEFPSEEHSFK